MSIKERKKSWLEGESKKVEGILHDLGTVYFAKELYDGRPNPYVWIDEDVDKRVNVELYKTLENFANYELQRYAILKGMPLRTIYKNFDIVATIEKGKLVPEGREPKKFGNMDDVKKEIESLKMLWTTYNFLSGTIARDADAALSGELLKQTIKVLYTLEAKPFDNDNVNDFVFNKDKALRMVARNVMESIKAKGDALDRKLYQDEMDVDEKTQAATKKNFADIRAIPETKDEYIQGLLGKGEAIRQSAEQEKDMISSEYDEDVKKLVRRLYRDEMYWDETAKEELKKNYAEIRFVVERYKRQIKECMAKGIEIQERAEQRKESCRAKYAEDMNRLTRELYKADMAVDEKTYEVTKKNFADIRAISETHGKYVHDLLEKGAEIRESAEQEKESIRAKYDENKNTLAEDKKAIKEFIAEL